MSLYEHSPERYEIHVDVNDLTTQEVQYAGTLEAAEAIARASTPNGPLPWIIDRASRKVVMVGGQPVNREADGSDRFSILDALRDVFRS